MQTKDFYFAIDMVYENSYEPFEVVEGDTGNVLHITLKSNGEAQTLNDCYICAVFSSSSGFAMQDNDSGVTIGEETGTLDLQLLPTSYGPGRVEMDIQVYTTPSRAILVTSQRIDFNCKRTIISEQTIRENVAFPPLVAATQDAIDAAAEAREAIAGIEGRLGETNVQSDWNVTDNQSDAFIKNKPYLPAEPEDVGAAPAAHASQHALAGDDPIAIGASAELTVAGWTGTEAPYSQTVLVTGVTENNAVVASPAPASITAYGVAECRCTGQAAGTLTFQCERKPDAALTVNVLILT